MERTPEETKIQQEIEMHEAEARLCRDFATAEPAKSSAYLLRRASGGYRDGNDCYWLAGIYRPDGSLVYDSAPDSFATKREAEEWATREIHGLEVSA